MPYAANITPPPSLTDIRKLIGEATKFQTIVMLNDVKYFDLPLHDPNTIMVKARAATLAAELTDDANMLPIAKGWLMEFVDGSHSFAGAAKWLSKPIPTGDES